VDGYFEETKISRIKIGDRASVQLVGDPRLLTGRVESISPGIEDRERGPSGDLLPNVNPTFSWVRLAQRIPVRIRLDRPPANVSLIAGRTATVVIHPGGLKGDRKTGLWP
jgi:multidrug resistance efflux pump